MPKVRHGKITNGSGQRDGERGHPDLFSKSSPRPPSSSVDRLPTELLPSKYSSVQAAHRSRHSQSPPRERQDVSSPADERNRYRSRPKFTRDDQSPPLNMQSGFRHEIEADDGAAWHNDCARSPRLNGTHISSRLPALSPPPLRRQSPSRFKSSVRSSHESVEAKAPHKTEQGDVAGMDFGMQPPQSVQRFKRTPYAVSHVFLSAEDKEASKPEYVKHIRGIFKNFQPDKIEWDTYGFYVLFPPTLEGRNKATQAAKKKDVRLFGRWALKPVLCMPSSKAQQPDAQKRQTSATDQALVTDSLPHVHVVFDQFGPRFDLLQDVNDAFERFEPSEVRSTDRGIEVLFPATAEGRSLAKLAAQEVNGTSVRNSNCIRAKYNEMHSSAGDLQLSSRSSSPGLVIQGRAAARTQQMNNTTREEAETTSLARSSEARPPNASPDAGSILAPAHAMPATQLRLDHCLDKGRPQSDDASLVSGATSSSRSKTPKCHVCKALGGTMIRCSNLGCGRCYRRHCLSLDTVWDPQSSNWRCDRCKRKGIPRKRLASEALEVPNDALLKQRPVPQPAHKRSNAVLSSGTTASNDATGDNTECSAETLKLVHRLPVPLAEKPELLQQTPVSATEWDFIFNLDAGLFLLAHGGANNQKRELSANERLLHERIMHTGWQTWKEWLTDASTLLNLAPPTRLWSTFAQMRIDEIRALAFEAQNNSYQSSPDLDREKQVRDALDVLRMHVIPGIEEQEWDEQHRNEQSQEAIVGGLLGNIVTLQLELTGLRARHETPTAGTESQLRWDHEILVQGRSSLAHEDTPLSAWVDARIASLMDMLDTAQNPAPEKDSGAAKLPWTVSEDTGSASKTQKSRETSPASVVETLDAVASVDVTASADTSEDTETAWSDHGAQILQKPPTQDPVDTHGFPELDVLVDQSFTEHHTVEKVVSGKKASISQLIKRRPRAAGSGNDNGKANGGNAPIPDLPAGHDMTKQTTAASTRPQSPARPSDRAEAMSSIPNASTDPTAARSKQSQEYAAHLEVGDDALQKSEAEQPAVQNVEHSTLSHKAEQPRTARKGPLKGRRTKPETFKCTSCKEKNVQRGPFGRTVCMDCRDRASRDNDLSRPISKPSLPVVTTVEQDVSRPQTSPTVPERPEPRSSEPDADGEAQSDAFTDATIETERWPPTYSRSAAKSSAPTSMSCSATREPREGLPHQSQEKSALNISHPDAPPEHESAEPVPDGSVEAGTGTFQDSRSLSKRIRPVPCAQPEKKKYTRVLQRVAAKDEYDLGDSFARPKGTYCRLIALALCAAPDHRATPSQVVQWIADKIPGYDLKLGSWVGGVKASMIMNAQGRLGRIIASVTTVIGADRRESKVYELLPTAAEELEQWDHVLQQPVLPKPSQHEPGAGEISAAPPDDTDGDALNPDHRASPGVAKIGAPRMSEDALPPGHDAAVEDASNCAAHSQNLEATQSLEHNNGHSETGKGATDTVAGPEVQTGLSPRDMLRPRELSDTKSSGKTYAEERDGVWTTTRSLYEEWPDLIPKAPFDMQAKLKEIASRPTRKQRLAMRLAHPPFEPIKTLKPRSPTSAVPVIQHSSPEEPVYADDGDVIVHFDSVDEFLGITEDLEACVHDRELAFKPATSSKRVFFKTGIAM